MFPSEQPGYFSWPYPSTQNQYPTAEDLLYSATMDHQDRGMGPSSQYSAPQPQYSAPQPQYSEPQQHYSEPQSQQYYAAPQYGNPDLQQQGYASGMDASVYGQNYADDQGYAAQEESYIAPQEYNQVQSREYIPTQSQASAYDMNGNAYGYDNSYSTAGGQYDASAGSYVVQTSSSYVNTMAPLATQDLQYSRRSTYDQEDHSSIYTHPRLYSPAGPSHVGNSQANYSEPSRQLLAAQYLQQSVASQPNQPLAAFESPASRSARLKISEPIPQAPVQASGLAGRPAQHSVMRVNSHMTQDQEKLKEAAVMKQLLVEQLARTAPWWCIVLNYLGPAAAKQAAFTSAQLVQLFSERKITCATLLLGISSNNMAVVKRQVNPAFLRPLVFLLSILKSGAAYTPASEVDLARDFPAPGWCIPACIFKPRSRAQTNLARSGSGGRGPSRQGYINQLQARSEKISQAPATDDDEVSCADRLLKSVPMWGVLTSYTQMGAWRCPPNIPGKEAARQFAAGALSMSTPILGTLDPAQRGQWMPTGLVLPLGVILHLTMHEGLEYTPIPAADLSFYTVDVLKTITGKPDRASLWVAAAAAGDECAMAVVAAVAPLHSDQERSVAQQAVKAGIMNPLWAAQRTPIPLSDSRTSQGTRTSSAFTSAPVTDSIPSRGSGAGSVQMGLAASLAALDVNSNTSEDSGDLWLQPQQTSTSTAANENPGSSVRVSTLGSKQIVTSWPGASADAVTFASIDRERASEGRSSHAESSAHLDETSVPLSSRWHVITKESGDVLSPDQSSSIASVKSPETVRHSDTAAPSLNAGQDGYSSETLALSASGSLAAEAGMPAQRRVSGIYFGSVEVEGNTADNNGGTAPRSERLTSRLPSAGSPTNSALAASNTTPPSSKSVLFVMDATMSADGPLNIVLAPAGYSATAASSSQNSTSTLSPDPVGACPFVPGSKLLSGPAKAKPASFAMPVPMAVTKSSTAKTLSGKTGRSKTGTIFLPVPVPTQQPTPPQVSSPSSPQLPPCGISALSPTSLPFSKFETAVFRLFMGDTSQYSFTSLWWYLDASNGISKVLGPFSCEQMMLAYIAQLLNNNVPVCGSVSTIVPPLHPHLSLFRPLGDLILGVGSNVPYCLATQEDVISAVVEPCNTSQLTSPAQEDSNSAEVAETSAVL